MGTTEPKKYELILLGASGYTGKLCAEHITHKLPTNLKWAVAGRSERKLCYLIDQLRTVNVDRLRPGIEVVTLRPDDLDALAKQTRLLINTIGPYHLYSSPVVEACARNGTHYLDATGETPWVLEIIKKHHQTAKENHAIIIPEIGLDSAPSDLLAWLVVMTIREKLSVGTKEVVGSLHDKKLVPSGGTLFTLLSLQDHYSVKQMLDSFRPWALSPVPGPKPDRPLSILSRVFGIRSVPDLGIQSRSFLAPANQAIVQRSWGLLNDDGLYGPKFTYSEYQRVGNYLQGIGWQFAIMLTILALRFPPFQWLIKKMVYSPGEGPPRHSHSSEFVELRTVGEADENVSKPRRALARFRWDGSIYYLTGVFLAEAAMVILHSDTVTTKLEGGVLTPACLGQPLIDRLKDAGAVFEVDMLSDKSKST